MEQIQNISNQGFEAQLKDIFQAHSTEQLIPIMADFKQLMTFYHYTLGRCTMQI